VRTYRPTARLISLCVLAAVLASGLGGQAPGMASAVGSAAAQPWSLAPAGRTLGRTLPPAGVWRPAAQEEEEGAPSAECDVRGIVESPAEGATVPAGPLTITGWAADIVATGGTGIDEVRVSLDADPDQGGVPVSANYGMDRPDIAELLGDARYTPTGFALAWDSTSTTSGPHVLYVQVHGTCGWTGTSRNVVVAGTSAQAAPTSVVAVAAGASAPATTPTPPAVTGSPPATSATLVFPTVPLVTTTRPPGSPGGTGTPASAASAVPGAATVPLTTATIAPSPTGSIPGPTNVTATLNPMDGSINLNWTAPAAMIRGYLVVTNEADGSQKTVREVPGSATRAVVTGLDPRIGYSLSVVPIDSLGRRGSSSAAISTAGAMTATPIPTPTLSPYCTPVPMGPPMCPQGGYPGAPGGYPGGPYPGGAYPGGAYGAGAYPGGAYPGMACPPTGAGIGAPYGAPGPYGVPGQFGPGNPFGAPMPYGVPPGGVPPGCYGQPYGVGGSFTVTATLINPSTAQLTWTPPPNATAYSVWQGVNGQPLTMYQSVGNATTAQVPLSQPGASYQFQVRAQVSNGPEIVSNTVPLTGTGVGYPVGVPGVGGCGAPGQACASRSSATASAPTMSMTTGGQINVTVLDMNGAPVVGAPVTVTGNGQVTPPTAPSGPGGVITFFARGNVPGPATFTVTVNGQPLPVPVSINFTP
jgi:hypothetical protein